MGITAPPLIPTTNEQLTIHCDYRSQGLAKRLSNLYPYKFVFYGQEYGSFEAFLQSIKFVTEEEKQHIYPMYGVQAFKAGQAGNAWKLNQILFHQNRGYERSSRNYQILISRAYDALFEQNPDFQQALRQSRAAELRHDFGKTDMTDSVLTQVEYLYSLYRLCARAFS